MNHPMKQLGPGLLLIAAILGASPGQAVAGTVRVEPSTAPAEPGATLVVPVVVDARGESLTALGVDLHFDATIAEVEILRGPDAPLGMDLRWRSVAAGHLRAALLTTDQSLGGGGVLLLLRIRSLSEGALTLALTAEGSDASARSIAMDCRSTALFFRAGSASDLDGDGLAGSADNCPHHSNVAQADREADGIGDACDNCVLFSNQNQEDEDADEQGDACEFSWGDLAPRDAPDGRIDVSDVVLTLRFAVGLDRMTDDENRRANVSPARPIEGAGGEGLLPDLSAPSVVDVGDVVLSLRAAVGLVEFVRPF